jgi:predicted ATPase/DNA-binding SARP family transcriptional activator
VLSIAVLGPVEITRNGAPVTVPRGKTSELLIRLALDAGTLVRADRLVEDLWSDDAVHTSRNTLQSKIAKLRRALGDPAVLVSGDGGYTLAVDPGDVDALAAVRHAAEAARLLAAGDDQGAADLCASTLQMYHGEVLAGAGGADWAAPHRTRLEEARMRLLETWCSARLRLSDAAEVVGDLEVAVTTYPFQESLWALLITALYESGRQADALASYQRVRTLLADELGLDPGPRLHQLERQILTQDGSLAVRGPAGEAAAVIGNLPSMSSELVGREGLVAEVSNVLAASRLVEIVGPGGVGKTALAIATGRTLHLPGGVWLARLEMATTADEVVDTVIAAMNVTGGEAALLERLRRADTVVILDNCEHVIDAAAELAARLLDAAARLRILCTSQVPLGIDGETVVELEPLPLADAVDLFHRRAEAQRASRDLRDADDAILELCRSLDGLPLAIELAAARTRTLSIEDITRRLDDRFALLRDPTSRKPERRRALGATIRWSYDLLFPDDQRGLWALATFVGGAPLEAAEYVIDALAVPSPAAIDVVGRLASRSLVIVDDDTSSLRRYRLLESIRAFALGAMSEAGLTDTALAAHARWFAERAAASTNGVRSSRQAEHLSFARTERANIDAALAWSTAHDPQLALNIASGFGWAWVVLGDSRGAQRILSAVDAAGDLAPSEDRANALLLASWLEASTGDLARARHHIAAAEHLAVAVDDDELRARCCYYLAYVVSHEGEFDQATELTARCRELYGERERPWDQAANALFAARAAISAGDTSRAVDARDQVERWLAKVDDPWLHVRREALLGELARLQHRFDDAVTHLARAADTSRRRGYLQTEAYQVASLGRAQCQAGDYPAGAATLRLAIDKAESTGDVRMATLARVHLGRVLRALGDHDEARAVLEAAAAWHREAGGGEQARLGDCLLAAIDAADDQPGADDRLATILDAARAHDEPHVEVFALDALARSAARHGDVESANALDAEADGCMEAASHFITERDRTDARHRRHSVTAR